MSVRGQPDAARRLGMQYGQEGEQARAVDEGFALLMARQSVAAAARLVRVLPGWRAKALPAQIVYPVQRQQPLRVRTFIDFASEYVSTVLKPRHDAGG